MQIHINYEGYNLDTCNTIFCWAIIAETKNKAIYINLAGKFPYCLYKGSKYIFFAYDYNSNSIISIPMPNREAPTIVTSIPSICNMLEQKHCKAQFCKLDNEASNTIKVFLIQESMDYQFVFLKRTYSQCCRKSSSDF